MLLISDIDRAFRGDRAFTMYRYPKTGYTDYEVTYPGVPDLGVELHPKALRGRRMWMGARIYFTPDEEILSAFISTGQSKYMMAADEMLAIAQIKPAENAQDVFNDMSLVALDVGHGRISSVAFLLYDGPEFPKWFYED